MPWSLTSVSTFEKCPRQYKYRYVDRLPGKKSAAAQRGVDQHKIFEQFMKKEVEQLLPHHDYYESFLRHLRDMENYPEVKLAVRNDWSKCEWDDEQVWWRGVLDLLVFPSPDIAVIYDWKTGKIWPDHDDQKDLYSIVVAATFPDVREVRAVHVYIDLGKSRQRTYGLSDLLQMRSKWESRSRVALHSTEFIPNPSYSCRFCPFSRESGGPCEF
jgi:ATP-dependent exoDNAse (exonuclease V) beta subunit